MNPELIPYNIIESTRHQKLATVMWFRSRKKQSWYSNTFSDHIVSEANNPASEASLAKFGANRQFFASWI